MVRIHNIEAEDRTTIEMKGVQLKVSECENSVEKILERMDASKSTFAEW